MWDTLYLIVPEWEIPKLYSNYYQEKGYFRNKFQCFNLDFLDLSANISHYCHSYN